MSCENEKEYARLQIKYTSITGASPSLPYTQDHNDGTWSPTDLYVGEFFLNASDDQLWIRTFNGIIPVGGTGSGTGSYIGDFVSKTNGGSYSGTVSIPHLNGGDATFNEGTFTDLYTTDLWATTLHGDGSGLTGIISEWTGGTISNPSTFTFPATFNDEIWLNGNVNSIYGEVVFNDNLTSYGSISANTYIGDGSQLTGLPIGITESHYTTGAYLDGTVVRFDRTDLNNAYSVDLTPIIGTYSPQSFNWDGVNTMTVYLVDGSFLTMEISTFDNLSLTGDLTANDVYANTFYGNFVGTFAGGMTGSTGPSGPAGATGNNGAPGTNGFLIVNTTWLNFITRYGDGTLSKGVRYKIYDLSGDDIGPFSIWIDALDTDKVSDYGTIEMTIVRPEAYTENGIGSIFVGVWSEYGCGYSGNTPDIGDVCIWGGYTYENITGNLGTALSDTELDSTDWIRNSTFDEKIGGTYYEKRFSLELNFQDYEAGDTTWTEDLIRCINDDRGNTVFRDSANSIGWKITDWGDPNILNNTTCGIWNNIVQTSLRDNKVETKIEYNQYDVIAHNECYSIFNNFGTSIGQITYNSVGIIAGNMTQGEIKNNISFGENGITGNGDAAWVYNISDNRCGDITDNLNDGNISYNIITGDIWENLCAGLIAWNMNNGYIGANTANVGYITYNSNNGDINENNNIGGISHNSNNGHITENYDGVTDIEDNANNGQIFRNDNVGPISTNSNVGQIIYNQNTGSIGVNKNTGDISYNTSLTTNIESNSNNGGITYNDNTGSITSNINDGSIQQNYDTVGNINSNSNVGQIYYNSNAGSIYFNSNNGDISTNTMSGGEIWYNSNNGDISTNSITGHIENNSNNGTISHNTQTSGSTNISYNNNNGNISNTGRTGVIVGTQVNL
jgi:hypothetical protein